MRIALVAPRFAPDIGGVETHVRELAMRFSGWGMRVEVLTQTANRELPRQDKIGDVNIRRFPVLVRSKDYAAAPSLPVFMAFNRLRYDLIHIHNYHALPAVNAALVTGDRPLVFTPHYHGVGHSKFSNAMHYPYRLVGLALFRKCDQVICVSDSERDLLVRHFPDVAPKVKVVPNGIGTHDIVVASPFDMQGRVVLTVGRLEKYKQVDVVVRAMELLDSSYVLRVIGRGSEEARLRRQVQERDLGSRVEFLGQIDRAALCRWYRTARVYVSASTKEAFGISPLEALVGGASVVLSDIPAHREILERDRKSRGVMMHGPLTPATVARAIEAAARAFDEPTVVPTPQSWDSVAKQTAEIYLGAIQRRHRRSLSWEHTGA